MTNTLTANMSLSAFWHAKGKNDARNGRVAQFELNPRQRERYTEEEQTTAHHSYNAGYSAGLPEEPGV
jgi:hypothetical protein